MFLRLFPAPSLFFFSALIYFVFLSFCLIKKAIRSVQSALSCAHAHKHTCAQTHTQPNKSLYSITHLGKYFDIRIFTFFYHVSFIFSSSSLFITSYAQLLHTCQSYTHVIYTQIHTQSHPYAHFPISHLILSIWKVSQHDTKSKRNIFLLGIWSRRLLNPFPVKLKHRISYDLILERMLARYSHSISVGSSLKTTNLGSVSDSASFQ